MTDDVLGYFIDRLVPPWHMCAGGERVLSEKAVRLKDLPASVDQLQIREWMEKELGVSPSKILQDSLAQNSVAAMAGAEGSLVTWVVEFNAKSDCMEIEADVERALQLNNRALKGSVVKVERIRTRGAGLSKCTFHSC